MVLLESSLQYLRCVLCQKRLALEILDKNSEVEEGFLVCSGCKVRYPIISKIPILWGDLSVYLSNRAELGGELLLKATSQKMKSFVKYALSKIKKGVDDIGWVEKKWVSIYLGSKNSRFYHTIKKSLATLQKTNLVLEHGCSVGLISEFLAKRHKQVFGIDSSFYAILEAKKTKRENLDYFVADSLSHPFGEQKFDLVVGLNLLELIEPKELIKTISSHINKGTVVISDPYDFERGKKTVKHPLNEKILRGELAKNGFKILPSTKKPSFIPWNLKINNRTNLNYKVDLVVAKK